MSHPSGPLLAILWAGALVAGCFCSLLMAQRYPDGDPLIPPSPGTQVVAPPVDEPAGQLPRLREGMYLSDAAGHFERAAEGPVFVHENGHRLAGLENLNLQRIARTLLAVEEPAGVEWRVSGLITEYEGRNYILIERAVYSPSRR